MQCVTANCWYTIFLDAYTYSTNYLLFAIIIIIASIILLWIYEKPQFYKIMLKRSKQSNVMSPGQSIEVLEENFNIKMDGDVSNTITVQNKPEVFKPIGLDFKTSFRSNKS